MRRSGAAGDSTAPWAAGVDSTAPWAAAVDFDAALGGVDQVDDDVGLVEGGERGGAHRGLEFVLWLEEAWGVEEDDLRLLVGDDADDAVAGGLGFGARDGESRADESVEECGLAGVGSAGDGDEAGAGGHWSGKWGG